MKKLHFSNILDFIWTWTLHLKNLLDCRLLGLSFKKSGLDLDRKIWQFAHLCLTEMITIRFAGWIFGRIVSSQPDKDIQKLLSNGNRIRIRISQTLLSIFRGFWFLQKVHIAQSFAYYLQKHLFSLLRHDFESLYGVISEPQSYAKFVRMNLFLVWQDGVLFQCTLKGRCLLRTWTKAS